MRVRVPTAAPFFRQFDGPTSPGGTESALARLLNDAGNRGPFPSPTARRKLFDPAVRQKRQFDQLVAFTQKLWRDSESVRDEFFWNKPDTSSPEK